MKISRHEDIQDLNTLKELLSEGRILSFGKDLRTGKLFYCVKNLISFSEANSISNRILEEEEVNLEEENSDFDAEEGD